MAKHVKMLLMTEVYLCVVELEEIYKLSGTTA